MECKKLSEKTIEEIKPMIQKDQFTNIHSLNKINLGIKASILNVQKYTKKVSNLPVENSAKLKRVHFQNSDVGGISDDSFGRECGPGQFFKPQNPQKQLYKQTSDQTSCSSNANPKIIKKILRKKSLFCPNRK